MGVAGASVGTEVLGEVGVASGRAMSGRWSGNSVAVVAVLLLFTFGCPEGKPSKQNVCGWETTHPSSHRPASRFVSQFVADGLVLAGSSRSRPSQGWRLDAELQMMPVIIL